MLRVALLLGCSCVGSEAVRVERNRQAEVESLVDAGRQPEQG